MRSFALRFLLPLAFAGIAAGSPALAQKPAVQGCTLNNGTYTCDNVTFQRALHNAQTVSIETGRIDRIGRAQLEDLVRKLGKTVADGTTGDLVFALRPTNNDGVNVVNGEVELTTLRIYAGASTPGSTAGDRTLLWAETYRQRPDTPWAATVHGVILQFEKHFAPR